MKQSFIDELSDLQMPNSDDWVTQYNDSDFKYTYAKLFGVQRKDAYKILLNNPNSYVEYIACIPKKAFAYYFSVLVEYLLSKDSSLEPGSTSSLFRMIKFDLESELYQTEGIWTYLPELLEIVSNRQSHYGADENIFGNYRELADEVLDLVNTSKGDSK